MSLIAAQAATGWAAEPGPRETEKAHQAMVLWYRQPARKWMEALPLGNGLMGGMVFGGLSRERIALNESSFWSGRPHDYDNPEAYQYFPRIRDLVFAGKFQEAEKMADEHFYGLPAAQQAYQPLGDLVLSFEGVEKAENYRRKLDLESGVAKITYRVGDVSFTREVFVSYPDRVVVMHVAGDKPGRVSLQAQFKSPYLERAVAQAGQLVMEGCWKGPITNNWLVAPVEGKGLRFEAGLLARPEGGRAEAAEGSVRIEGANAVTLIVAAATSFVSYRDIGGDAAAAREKILAGVAGKDYATLRRRHEADFRGLMSRVQLQVGEPSRNEQPTDERLKALRQGRRDPNLEALCFQFGRYLLAASSRAGGQPANLQGIWNEAVSPSWGSKYTININTCSRIASKRVNSWAWTRSSGVNWKPRSSGFRPTRQTAWDISKSGSRIGSRVPRATTSRPTSPSSPAIRSFCAGTRPWPERFRNGWKPAGGGAVGRRPGTWRCGRGWNVRTRWTRSCRRSSAIPWRTTCTTVGPTNRTPASG